LDGSPKVTTDKLQQRVIYSAAGVVSNTRKLLELLEIEMLHSRNF